MIEIFSILLNLLVITIFCYPSKYLINFFSNNKNINFIEKLEIGIVINIFFLLIASFFLRKNSNIVFYFILIFFLINLYTFFKDYFESFKVKKVFFNNEFFIFFLLAFIFSINLSNNLKIGWDAQNYWLVKKLVFTNNGDIFDLQFTPIKSYPYLGSFLWFFYSKISFSGYEYFGRIFYLFLFLVSIFSIFNIHALDPFKKILLTALTVFLIYRLDLFNGYQEVLIFSLTAILTKTFFKYLNSYDKKYNFHNYFYFIAIIIMNIIFIKNDALIVILTFFLSLLLIRINVLDKFKFLFIIFFVLCFKYILFFYINLSNNLQEDNYRDITIIKILDLLNLERFFLISKYLLFAFFDNVLFSIGVIFLIILYKYCKKDRSYLFLLFSCLFSTLFIFIAFLLTSLPIEFHLKTAMNRLLFEASAFSLILIPFFLNKFKILK